MTVDPDVEHALSAAGLGAARPARGAGMTAVELSDGRIVAVKRSSRIATLRAEADGLAALRASGHLLVPEVYGLSETAAGAVLLTQYFESAPVAPATWSAFGAGLARHHAASVPRQGFGFAADNFIGATPQPNGWCADWVSFMRSRRLAPQIERARNGRRLSGEEARVFECVADRLDGWLEPQPRPSMLHGDLWSGNAIGTRAGVAVIDPAVSIGDGVADLAMMALFGGFPVEAEAAYYATRVESGCPDPEADRAERIALYQLYHLLNHVNLFGRGYLAQARAVAARLPGGTTTG